MPRTSNTGRLTTTLSTNSPVDYPPVLPPSTVVETLLWRSGRVAMLRTGVPTGTDDYLQLSVYLGKPRILSPMMLR